MRVSGPETSTPEAVSRLCARRFAPPAPGATSPPSCPVGLPRGEKTSPELSFSPVSGPDVLRLGGVTSDPPRPNPDPGRRPFRRSGTYRFGHQIWATARRPPGIPRIDTWLRGGRRRRRHGRPCHRCEPAGPSPYPRRSRPHFPKLRTVSTSPRRHQPANTRAIRETGGHRVRDTGRDNPTIVADYVAPRYGWRGLAGN